MDSLLERQQDFEKKILPSLMASGIYVSYAMMLQKGNWTISYLLKPYLVKLVETDTLEKPIHYFLLSLLQEQRF